MVQLSGLAAHKKPRIWAWQPPKSLDYMVFHFELWLILIVFLLACSNIFSARHFLAQLGLEFYVDSLYLKPEFS